MMTLYFCRNWPTPCDSGYCIKYAFFIHSNRKVFTMKKVALFAVATAFALGTSGAMAKPVDAEEQKLDSVSPVETVVSLKPTTPKTGNGGTVGF